MRVHACVTAQGPHVRAAHVHARARNCARVGTASPVHRACGARQAVGHGTGRCVCVADTSWGLSLPGQSCNAPPSHLTAPCRVSAHLMPSIHPSTPPSSPSKPLQTHHVCNPPVTMTPVTNPVTSGAGLPRWRRDHPQAPLRGHRGRQQGVLQDHRHRVPPQQGRQAHHRVRGKL